jgi:hypothetical protein
MLGARLQKRPERLDRSQPHLCRRAGGEDAEDHLFPEPRVRSRLPNVSEFTQSRSNLFPSLTIRDEHAIDVYRFTFSAHKFSMIEF